jgi:hypothetical protein
MGHWCEIKPHVTRKHRWVFAEYYEFPSERPDKEWYAAFLFRDDDRTVFGIREYVGQLPNRDDLRNLATKVVTDEAFRKTLVSDNAELRVMWKRR